MQFKCIPLYFDIFHTMRRFFLDARTSICCFQIYTCFGHLACWVLHILNCIPFNKYLPWRTSNLSFTHEELLQSRLIRKHNCSILQVSCCFTTARSWDFLAALCFDLRAKLNDFRINSNLCACVCARACRCVWLCMYTVCSIFILFLL